MKKERIIFSLRPRLAEWLRTRAQESGRSLSAEVEWSLEQYCTERVREGMHNLLTKNVRKRRG
jgi:hypothetical protein